jgi:glycosyltransferase involved in cell wall biosynthesis
MRPYGGVISVINIANELVLAGLDVRLVTMSRFKGLEHQLYTEPIYCRDREDIPGCFPQVDIAVATQWETVEHILTVSRLQPRAKTFYFIQDYEVNFLPEEDTRSRSRVIETYSHIRRKVVKTEHLREQIVRHDPVCFKISPGMDLDAFYPRTPPEGRHARRVLCMARPRTPWRGFHTMCRVFSALHRQAPDIEFVLYGTDDLSEHETTMGFPYANRGMVSHRELPALYNSAAIYCDFSLAHGFGRTGVEAMACGCACVLTESGGVSEYAMDEWNALLRGPSDEVELAAAIMRLMRGPELRAYFARNGMETVRGYSDRVAARQMLELFRTAQAGQL